MQPIDPRWSDDAFLDSLRDQGDELADTTVAELMVSGDVGAVSRLFKLMTADADPIPDAAAEPFKRFIAATGNLPEWVDMERLERGEEVYFRHALPLALSLLAKSLPEGYSAPPLTRILHLSGDLDHHPYRRLLGVLQMVVNVSSRGGFTGDGSAIVTAQKLRLLHSGVRHIADKAMPDYRRTFNVPVNHEDMLATVIGFSYLVIEGLQRLRVGLTEAEAEDLYYTWRVFALMMGIHPPGKPGDASLIPDSVANARAFYDNYGRRHFTGAAENPEGVQLAQHNLDMMVQLLPRWLRWFGFGVAPRIYMNELMDQAARQRVAIAPVAGHGFVKWLVLGLPVWLDRLTGKTKTQRLDALTERLFEGMIVKSYGGRVEFLLPENIADLRRLA